MGACGWPCRQAASHLPDARHVQRAACRPRVAESTPHPALPEQNNSTVLLLNYPQFQRGNRRQGAGALTHVPEKFLVASMVVKMAPCERQNQQRSCCLTGHTVLGHRPPGLTCGLGFGFLTAAAPRDGGRYPAAPTDGRATAAPTQLFF